MALPIESLIEGYLDLQREWQLHDARFRIRVSVLTPAIRHPLKSGVRAGENPENIDIKPCVFIDGEVAQLVRATAS